MHDFKYALRQFRYRDTIVAVALNGAAVFASYFAAPRAFVLDPVLALTTRVIAR